MYVGNDRAIALALEIDPDLVRKSLEKGIMIVTPTTFLLTLKVIELFCREDKQIENLKEISAIGGHLYKKIGLFVEKLRDVQSSLDNSSEALKVALNHLNRGNSSILSDAKELNKLGGFSQKDIPEIGE